MSHSRCTSGAAWLALYFEILHNDSSEWWKKYGEAMVNTKIKENENVPIFGFVNCWVNSNNCHHQKSIKCILYGFHILWNVNGWNISVNCVSSVKWGVNVRFCCFISTTSALQSEENSTEDILNECIAFLQDNGHQDWCDVIENVMMT